ncbi:MAG: glutamate--tRNA ligase [Candidatus Levybacteria bacterium RIFCSPHIGHO2_12_FULL_38_12]|nr:MAG: glutamate--tRNA ligase [Candidatus Levybacteria bacterium RIFCSPHIGHO2_01_FULL_38_12]OGH21926.1 MAG: glutamate--tRNA ligase [Candidatus Levybacteria bacterium RIFCSPHIGHO2_02_FULL_37_18]OGH22858.1 MAG: glutamate--tRNA ligase [Candidatus Levybacteria bacterium RIFCSPHIGHO2_12_FULL_38_12]OGH33583.1 MAG: glutamate--tRNA ligase [Candidatus Levybacteria bacterium RIFCSPLOWO2_01_FULL_37_20]OGH44504.1 MAG: glutamate--tRNA ligase [Candidatus Levybacteria bacterium RIFCSPLOWO2_02_FULL_37_18]OGH
MKDNTKSSIRVRIAPSPTGTPHIGNTRTALLNYLFAKHNNGAFILRIEDTDQARIVEGAVEAIEEILNWLGLVPDERYVQSQRLDLYKEKADELVQKGLTKKENGAVRFIIPNNRTLEWTDAVGNKKISFHSNDVEDFIILKSDGFPTYHLASVVDDNDTNISHVFRGEEWISSTPKHLLLYQAFGWIPPVFVHLPVIVGPDKQKLSKRHGAKSVLDYRDEGYLKEALLNFMVLLGWNPGGDREIMSMEEMIQLFDLKDINSSSPVFDAKKLEWMNGVYIREAQISNLKSQILAQNLKLTEISDAQLEKIIPIAQTRMKTLKEFNELVMPFFEQVEIKLDDKEKEVAHTLVQSLANVEVWNNEAILVVLKQIMQGEKLRMPILYKILTGKESGLPISDMLEIVGKEKTLEKLIRST